MKLQKVAFFDVDGTIVKGFLIVDFPAFLVKSGLFDKKQNDKIQELFTGYVEKKINPDIVAKKIPEHFAKGIKGFSVYEIQKGVQSFFKQVKYFNYTLRAMQVLRKNKYEIIAISGSPIFLLKGMKCKFDALYGSEFEVKKNHYTGKVKLNLALAKNKEKMLDKLFSIKHIDKDSSYAFGDTSHDIPMLSAVGHPMAVNPFGQFRKYVESQGWPIMSKVRDVNKNIH